MEERQSVFRIIMEKRLSIKLACSSPYLRYHFSDTKGVASYCLAHSSCESANFKISTGECSLFEFNSWENEFDIASDTDNIIIQKMGKSFVTHGEWTLVFRVVANINQPVYDTYIDTSVYYDQPLSPMYPIGCLHLDTNLSCDHHFRSCLLNNWAQLNITGVKISVFKDGVLQKYPLFNGSSSTSLSWFSSANLINSSWSDLPKSPIINFSIYGFDHVGSLRRFYIQSIHDECSTDNGWFVIVDQVW